MKVHEKLTFIRAKMRQLSGDMSSYGELITLSFKDKKFKEYQCSTEEILKSFSYRLSKELEWMDNPKACHSSCKWMYFCELEKGHEGIHREGGLGWGDEHSDQGQSWPKVRPRRKKKEIKQQMGNSRSR